MGKDARKVFNTNLLKLMERRGMSQSQLAENMGKSVSTIHEWYAGRRYPRVDCMQQLADVFGVRMSELTGENQELPQLDVTFRNIPIQMTDEEISLVLAYREADPTYQAVAMDILINHKKKDATALTAM